MQTKRFKLGLIEPREGTRLGVDEDLGLRGDVPVEEDGNVVKGSLFDLEKQVEAAQFGQFADGQGTFFLEFAMGGLVAGFTDVHPPARKPPLPHGGLVGTLEK